MSEVDAMLAVHRAVDIKILLDIECLFNLLISTDSIVEAVVLFAHHAKDSLMFCIGDHSVHLQ
jgi:hypothetical protein